MKQCLSCGLLALFLSLPAFAVTEPRGIRTVDAEKAPDFRLADMDGEWFELQDARGSWVFVHFWASWCGPCRKEMPAIQRMEEQLRNSDLEIVMINTAEDEDTIFSFMSIYAPDMTTLMDSDGLATEPWQPRGLPATYLVDPEGKLRYQALGGRPWDQPEYLDFLRSLINARPVTQKGRAPGAPP